MTLKNPFENPHYLAGSVLSRLAVNCATLIWSAVVLLKTDTLRSANASYAAVTEYVHEDVIAAVLGGVALVQIVWLCMHWAPVRVRGIRICPVGYGALTLAWSYALYYILLGPRPIQPTATAGTTTIVLLALFAFVSNATTDEGAGDGVGK